MTEPFNSASRVYDILVKTHQINQNEPARDAWAKVFDIEESDPIEKQYRTIEMLQALRQEAELAYSAAQTTTIPRAKYTNAFSSIQAALDPGFFTNAFSTVIAYFSREYLTVVNILIDLIESDGVPVDREEFQKLAARLEELERSIENTELSEDIRRFFLSQIRILLSAIRRYPIIGNKAFGEAIGQYIVAKAQSQEAAQRAAQDERAQETLAELQSIWILWFRLAEVAATVATLVDYGQRLLGG